VNPAEITSIVSPIIASLGDGALVDRGRAVDCLLDVRLEVDETTQIRVDRALAGLGSAGLVERSELVRVLEELTTEVPSPVG
jgi:hypothetical protein